IDTEVKVSTGATTVTHSAYDWSGNAWVDLDGSNAYQARRLYLDTTDSLEARVVGTTPAWYLADRQGSVRVVENFGGTAALDTLSYNGFGAVESESSTTNGDRYKYTG